MRYHCFCFLFSVSLFSQELEVDGSLKVTGDINATGNVLTNLGDPVSGTDAVNLRSLNDLASMKPSRIYNYYIELANSWTSEIVVPTGKFWSIKAASVNNEIEIKINGSSLGYIYKNVKTTFTAFPGDAVSFETYYAGPVISIFEYPITESGTDQGMDYVEP